MKTSNINGHSNATGFACILIGAGLMALNFVILDDGEFHMRLNILSNNDDSFFFTIKILFSCLASFFFFGLGLRAIFVNVKTTDKKNKRDRS
jgi:hypothetical protein